MAIEHVNRHGATYLLQQGTNSRGKPHYWFAMKLTGTPVDTLPPGCEIYEKPENCQVFLRKIKPTPILPFERQMVLDAIQKHAADQDCVVEVEGNDIVIYLSETDPRYEQELLRDFLPLTPARAASLRACMLRQRDYQKMLRFTLLEGHKRDFYAHRWCFRGSIDNWRAISGPAPLAKLLHKYIQHLGKESFFDLMYEIE